MKSYVKHITLMALTIAGISSCKKGTIISQPQPDEPELITTVRIKATNSANNSEVHYFSYRVENSFHGSGKSEFTVDTIKLNSNSVYDIEMSVLDEKKSPTIDVTPEIIEERNAHLFYYTGTPTSGAGAIEVFDKDKDGNGQDFARVCKWRTGERGRGSMEIILIHGPRNKEAATRNAIAGSSDAETIFPVQLQ